VVQHHTCAMTKVYLMDYLKSNVKFVEVANKARMDVERIESVTITMQDKVNNYLLIRLDRVLYVPKLGRNLLLVRAIAAKGHSVKFR
jgi:hypothetical protein